MAMTLRDDPTVTDGRKEDTPQRRYWREQARKRYRADPEKKRAIVERWQRENPERFREVQNLARKRRRRGLQRAYRKEPVA